MAKDNLSEECNRGRPVLVALPPQGNLPGGVGLGSDLGGNALAVGDLERLHERVVPVLLIAINPTATDTATTQL